MSPGQVQLPGMYPFLFLRQSFPDYPGPLLTGELSDNELRALELEENIRRKDLTDEEKSRNMAEWVQVVREQIREENCTDSAQFKDEQTEEQFRTPGVRNYNKKGGRPKESGSYRDISERTGIPVQTIRDAEKHVQMESNDDIRLYAMRRHY